MSERPPGRRRPRLHLFKTAVLLAFVGGLSALGASWSVYADRGCLDLATPSYCGEARWTMAAGAVFAIGAIVALWVRTMRRKRT